MHFKVLCGCEVTDHVNSDEILVVAYGNNSGCIYRPVSDS